MPQGNFSLKWIETGRDTPKLIADSMGATTLGTTNLVDYISEVDSVVNGAANLLISAFDMAPASNLDIEVSDHEKEKKVSIITVVIKVIEYAKKKE